MNSLEVSTALQSLPINTLVCAANRLPNAISTPCGIVVNTDPDSKPGTHWVAIYIDRFRNCEYFDSYGLPPFVNHHKKFLHTTSSKLIHNTREMQSLHSNVCGQYCLLYLYFRAHSRSLLDFQRLFSNNTLRNDEILKAKYQTCFKRVSCGKNVSHSKIQACCCRKIGVRRPLLF